MPMYLRFSKSIFNFVSVFLILWCYVCKGFVTPSYDIQYIPRNLHTVFALLCFVVVIHLPIFPYPSGLLHWHYGNLTIAPVPAKQPWWIWINTSCEFIMNDCITTTKQSTTKPCAYFLGYTVETQLRPRNESRVVIRWDVYFQSSTRQITQYRYTWGEHRMKATWFGNMFISGNKFISGHSARSL